MSLLLVLTSVSVIQLTSFSFVLSVSFFSSKDVVAVVTCRAAEAVALCYVLYRCSRALSLLLRGGQPSRCDS